MEQPRDARDNNSEVQAYSPAERSEGPRSMNAHLISGDLTPQPLLSGLELHVDKDGICLSEREGGNLGNLMSFAWPEVRRVSTVGEAVDPDGVPAQVIEVSGAGETIRFLVSTSDAPALAASLIEFGHSETATLASRPAGRHSTRAHRPQHAARVSGRITAGLVAGIAPASRGRRLLRSKSMHVAAIAAALIALLSGAGIFASKTIPTPTPQGALTAGNGAVAGMVTGGWKLKLNLPPATVPPEPAPRSLALSAPLRPHEIFGFAPYWTLPISSGFNLSSLTTIAYFGVNVNANGTLSKAGTGWAGFQSQYLATLITRAHAASVRVVLTAKCFSQSTLNALTSSPAAAKRLAGQLVTAIESKNMDGVNLDFEGTGSADQAGLTRLVSTVSAVLHSVDPHWQLTMDTYASAATDPAGFYNIPALSPAVNAFFVMAYDMNSFTTPSPTAPLAGTSPSDLSTITGYLSKVPAGKVILGVPFYGYDWPTSTGTFGAQATGSPVALSYAVIAAANLPTYWDPQTSTPWTAYQTGGQWHEIYFDNPVSMGLKANLANFFSLRGLGIWALGMDGNDPAMAAALLGHAPALKNWIAGPPPTRPPTTTTTRPPTTTTTTTPPTTTTTTTMPLYRYQGTWDAQTVTLRTLKNQQSGPPGTVQPAGQLTNFQTNDPAFECLNGDTLWVWTSANYPGQYLVDNALQNQCKTGTWLFRAVVTINISPGTP